MILDSGNNIEFTVSLVEANLANLTGDLVPPFNGYAKAGIVEVMNDQLSVALIH